MENVSLGELTYLYFLVNREIDRGKSAEISEVRDAIANERTIDFVRQYVDPAELERLPEDELDVAFRKYYVPDETDLAVENNGLLYLTANIVETIQIGNWTNDHGERVDASLLTL